MLDEHAGPIRDEAPQRAPDERRTVGVEVRRRLVEQQHVRAERQRPGDRQPLLLPAGERGGGMIAAVGEPDGGERGLDPRPDLRGGHAGVLQAERHVVAGAGEHELRIGILEDDPRGAIEAQRPLGFARSGAREQPGDPGEQGALSRAGGPEEEHPLAVLNDQVEAADGPRLPAGMPPAPAAGLDRRPGQTRCCVRPDANAESTPVRVSAVTRACEPRPAMTAALASMNTPMTS